jgi:hypothetical protein
MCFKTGSAVHMRRRKKRSPFLSKRIVTYDCSTALKSEDVLEELSSEIKYFFSLLNFSVMTCIPCAGR